MNTDNQGFTIETDKPPARSSNEGKRSSLDDEAEQAQAADKQEVKHLKTKQKIPDNTTENN